MKTKILALSLFLVLLIGFIPYSETQEPNYYLELKLSKTFGFRGDIIEVTTITNYAGFKLQIYDPNEILIYNQNHLANETIQIPISENQNYGFYRIVSKIPDQQNIKYFTVLERPNIKTSFPFTKEHQGLKYTFYANSSINVNGELWIHLPDLKHYFDSVKCYHSENVLTVRIKDTYINAFVDLSFFFLKERVKLYINGSLGSPIDFRFKIQTEKPYDISNEKLTLKESGVMGNYPKTFVEWGDLKNFLLEYENGTYYFQIKVKNTPKNFVLDPSFGRETIGGATLKMFDTIRGDRFLCPKSGTAQSITIYINSEWDSGEEIKCAIYKASDNTLVGTTEERSDGGSGWQTFNFADPKPSLTNQLYMLVMWGNAISEAEGIVIPYVITSWYRYYKHGAGYNGFPSPFDGDIGNSTYSYYSIFCNYSLDGGDTTKPQYWDLNHDNNHAGESCKFSVNWTDNVELSHSVFSWNSSGSWVNETISLSGSSDWHNVTKDLPNQLLVVSYRYYGNDTSNNWNKTNIQNITIIDVTHPLVSNIGNNNTLAGNTTLFYAYWSDNIDLSGYIFGTNNTGSWGNETWVSFSSNPDWSNVSKILNSTIGIRVEWEIWGNDTSNNWNTTELQFLITTVEYDDPPTYSLIGRNSTLAGNYTEFQTRWLDDYGLSGYIFGTNNTGSWVNDTWTSFSTNPDWSTAIKQLNSSVGIRIEWRFYANDSINQWTAIPLQYFITTQDIPTPISESESLALAMIALCIAILDLVLIFALWKS